MTGSRPPMYAELFIHGGTPDEMVLGTVTFPNQDEAAQWLTDHGYEITRISDDGVVYSVRTDNPEYFVLLSVQEPPPCS